VPWKHLRTQHHLEHAHAIVSAYLLYHSSLFTCLAFVVYYRIYAEDGAIPSKTSSSPDDPFLGRIKARSVPPPHTVNSLKRSIAKFENISDRTRSRLFLTPYSQSHMDDAGKVTILDHSGPGSLPQEPLALVAKLTDSERSAFEPVERRGLVNACTVSPNARYRALVYFTAFLFLMSGPSFEVYYLLYADDCEMPSKVAIDPEEPSLGRIRADCIAPPHTSSSILRHISIVEATPKLAFAYLFADVSCDTPLEKSYLPVLHSDGPGLSPDKPMAVVQGLQPLDGTYVIKNRACSTLYLGRSGIPKIALFFYINTGEPTNSHEQVKYCSLILEVLNSS
jgi:hypothetical protein